MNEEYRNARISKDRNYDGRFFFGVKTTGIFCRPSCPSRVASEKNVLYFANAFEALEKEFRPCRRCRPDIEVEYYHGNINGTDLVDQALRRIYDGYLAYHSLQDLAEELSVSSRHLRQLFVENLGVPPVKVARYHKVIFAKKLLLSSRRSITDVAMASGFGSIRQFNEAFIDVMGCTPSSVRKEAGVASDFPGETTLLLRYDQPFHFRQMLAFMRPRSMVGVELVADDMYSRTFRTGGCGRIFHGYGLS